MRLEELQKKMIGHITDPEIQEADFSLIKSQKNISAVERLGSYRRSCLNRLVESFKSDFEVTCHFLRENKFENFALQYLHEKPSHTHYVNELGRGFSDFLKGQLNNHEYPFIYDLIELEWRMVESFYDFSDFRVPNTDRAGLWVNPSLIFISSAWPLDKIWSEKKKYSAEDVLLVSWSHMNRVSQIKRLGRIEYSVLTSLFKTKSIEETIEALCRRYCEDELLPVFQKSLSNWVEDGLVQLSSVSKRGAD